MAGLAKEVWINQLTKKFYPDSSFLNYTKDFSSLVENDAINMADAGVDPDVLILRFVSNLICLRLKTHWFVGQKRLNTATTNWNQF